jgi:hypothetical protein
MFSLLAKTVGTQVLMLVRSDTDPTKNLPHALAMEAMVVPPNALAEAYFTPPLQGT